MDSFMFMSHLSDYVETLRVSDLCSMVEMFTAATTLHALAWSI
uniref:Uncharacterized protein n=1 Tax=Meloidogyne enterolobii TaxID=390850 RepID=A0A6V7W657_MELEN|nr:unnamed protein product [Meloidogyne enterolobii]